jgi:AcrR family transcriptional regulator
MSALKKKRQNNAKVEDTKVSILRSAAKLFAQNGFDATSVREIAKNSGVNIAMIYYYFQTKEGLYQEILEDACRALSLSLADCIDRKRDPEENIYCFIKTYINFLQNHKTLHLIFLRETISQTKLMKIIVKKYGLKIFGLVHGIIEEGVEKGVFREQDTTLSTINLFSMIRHYFTDEPLITTLFPNEKVKTKEYLTDHIFNIFMQGVKSSP